MSTSFYHQPISQIALAFKCDLQNHSPYPDKSIYGLTYAYLKLLSQIEEQGVLNLNSWITLKTITITILYIIHSDIVKQYVTANNKLVDKFYTEPIKCDDDVRIYFVRGKMYREDHSMNPIVCYRVTFKDQVIFYNSVIRYRFSHSVLSKYVMSLDECSMNIDLLLELKKIATYYRQYSLSDISKLFV
jgi:hypothetical protein